MGISLLINKKDWPGLARLANISDSQFSGLLNALTKAPYFSNAKALSAHLNTSLKSERIDGLDELVLLLDNLYHLREFAGVKPDRFLNDLSQEIQDTSFAEIQNESANKANLQNRLAKVFSIPALRIIAKADRLQRDGERLYCEAKILSDIRPVFDADPSAHPIGAVVSHTLKLAFHGTEHTDFHVVLDTDDLEGLKTVIERALAKDKTLREIMKEAKLENLGV